MCVCLTYLTISCALFLEMVYFPDVVLVFEVLELVSTVLTNLSTFSLKKTFL